MSPLKRINIRYAGEHFTLANRELSDVQAEIDTAIAEGRTLWLRVNRGEGAYQPADLLITASTPIALMGVELPPEDAAASDDDGDDDETMIIDLPDPLDPHLG